MSHFALLHIFGPETLDRNGQPICEVYQFDSEEQRQEWLCEFPDRGQAVTTDHPTIQRLLGPSPVFDVETPFRAD